MKKTFLLFVLLFAVFSITATESISTLQEIKRLVPSDIQVDDNFGGSISIDGDIAAVGTYHTMDGPRFAGYVYLYQKDNGGKDNWGIVKKLLPPESAGERSDRMFGNAIAIEGDVIAVGDGDYLNNNTLFGAVYIFQKDAGGVGNWGLIQTIIPFQTGSSNNFGNVIALQGEMLVVGDSFEVISGKEQGAVYIFHQNEGGDNNWGEVQKLTVPYDEDNIMFAASIAVDENSIMVGAPLDVNESIKSGAIYIYEKESDVKNSWKKTKKVMPSRLMEYGWFGDSLSLRNEILIAGVTADDEKGILSGTTYIFQKDEGGDNNWGEVQKVFASDAAEYQAFGSSPSLENDFFVVSARGDTDKSGALYLFEQNGNSDDKWYEIEKVGGSQTGSNSYFGGAIAIDENIVVVGARGERIAPDAGAGAAYIFYKIEQDIGDSGDITDTVNTTDSGNTANTVDAGNTADSGDTANTGNITNTADSSDDGSACSVLII